MTEEIGDDPRFSTWLHSVPDTLEVLGPAGSARVHLAAFARGDAAFPLPGSAYKVSDYMSEGGADPAAETIVALAFMFFIAADRVGGEC